MRRLDAILAAVPLPAAIVVAVLVVHRLPALPPRSLAWMLAAIGLLASVALPAVRPASSDRTSAPPGKGSVRQVWHFAAVLAAAAGIALVAADRGMSARIGPGQEGRDYVVVGRIASMPLVAERSTRFVFDIDDCGLGIPALDLATTTFYLRGEDPAREQALLQGYAELQPLPEIDSADFEALVASRQLLLAAVLLNSSTAGMRADAEAYSVTSVERLQRWLRTGRFSRVA